jgi:hypothetical protein
MKELEFFVEKNGTKKWKLDGKLHRLELFNGTKAWYIDDKLHRLDGPAIEYVDGIKLWWVDGKEYKNQQEHAIAAFLWMNEHERT